MSARPVIPTPTPGEAGAPLAFWKLRPAEAAELLGISRSRAYGLIAAGDLPSVRVGTSVRVPLAGLKKWLALQGGDPKEPEGREPRGRAMRAPRGPR